ncbi:hypothetical protein L6R52_10470 [Myxococcota bacterium]|nr:hypothetical protein [Myxococcota bacterium]
MVDSVGGAGRSSDAGARAAEASRDATRDASRDAGRTTEVGRTGEVTGARDAGLSAQDTAEVEAAVARETPDAEAARMQDEDSFERDRAVAAANPGNPANPVNPGNPEVQNLANPSAAVTATGTPTGVTPATAPTFEAMDAEMRSLGWTRSPEEARAAAERVRATVDALPEADRAEAMRELMRPVEDVAQSGLRDPNTGRYSPDRIEAVRAFSGMIGQRGVDGLATNLRTVNEENNLPARDAIARTLADTAMNNQSPDVMRSAARSLLNGPAEVVRDGLAGRIEGMSPESLANMSRTRGDVYTDQRLLGLAQGMDPAIGERLTAQGLRPEPLPDGTEALHTILDFAGLAPVIGEPADALNAYLYGREGRYADAAISAAGVATGIGSVGTATRLGLRGADDLGTAARTTGALREEAAAAAFRARGMDAHPANIVFNNTDIDVVLNTAQGRYAVLVGGDAKALRNGVVDEGVVRETLDRFRRAQEAARDVDGPFRADGVGALMAFPRATTDPRVIERFIRELGPQSVVLF